MSKRASHRQALRQLIDRFIGTPSNAAFEEKLAVVKEKLVDEILRINDRFSHNPSLDEALNSGDGTYKP